VLKIYEITKKFPKDEQFSLRAQLRRSAYSIPSNIIEGAARRSHKEFVYFLDIARASCEEIKYQLFLCKDLGYITNQDYESLNSQYEKVGMMLSKLIKKIKASSGERIAKKRNLAVESRSENEDI